MHSAIKNFKIRQSKLDSKSKVIEKVKEDQNNIDDVICPLPFHHIAIRPNGRVYPCCYFRHEDTPEEFNLSYKNVFYHPFLVSVRDKIKKGEQVSGCKQCYQNEKLTGKSMRKQFLEGYEKNVGVPFTIPETPEIRYIDLAFSNVCNNKCRMCGPDLSTNWYSDSKELGFPIPKGIISNEDPTKNIDLSKLDYLKLIGGEPMLEQDKFMAVLEKCNLPELRLFVATNVTVKPKLELMKLLRKCKEVKIACSIDAYGNLNDFLRKGSKWEEVEKNLRWYSNNFGNVLVHSIVSIYNINKFHELYEYVKEEYHNVTIQYMTVDGPNWIRPCNLPVDVKDRIMKDINRIDHDEIVEIVPMIYEALSRPGNFGLFKEYDDKLNYLRDEHWKNLNPELYEMIKEFYE